MSRDWAGKTQITRGLLGILFFLCGLSTWQPPYMGGQNPYMAVEGSQSKCPRRDQQELKGPFYYSLGSHIAYLLPFNSLGQPQSLPRAFKGRRPRLCLLMKKCQKVFRHVFKSPPIVKLFLRFRWLCSPVERHCSGYMQILQPKCLGSTHTFIVF